MRSLIILCLFTFVLVPLTYSEESADQSLFKAAKGEDDVALKALLEKGANVNASDADAWTLLMHAASGGHEKVLLLLLEKGADVKTKDGKGWTPLMLAAFQGNAANVKALLAKGADVNAKTGKNTTPLICASGGGHQEVVQLLLDAKADTNVKDSDGKTALGYATEKGRSTVVELLKKAGAKEEAAPVPGIPPPEKVAGDPSLMPQKGKPWTNSLGMKFVPVEGTEVLFSIWDTRVQDYAEFLKADGKEAGTPAGPTHPVVDVSWEDAKAFCKWLTEKERKAGLLTKEQEYRLPTDAEWSCAVGLEHEEGATPYEKKENVKIAVFPWGKEWPPPKGAGNYAPSLKVDDFDETSPVGSFKANKFGLYDMGGNISQWCEDLYLGQGSLDKSRVVRGSSWIDDSPADLVSSCRKSYVPGLRNGDYGFRCVVVFVVVAFPAASKAEPAFVPTEVTTKEKLAAFDPKNPQQALDAFDPGTTLTVVEPVEDGKMYHVKFTNSKGGVIEALCRAEAIELLLKADHPDDPGKEDQGVKSPVKGKPWKNSLGMKFVPVPGTEVLFSVWDTRVQDYEVFVKEMGGGWSKTNFKQGPTHPAVYVSWEDANDFCKWLTEKERKEGLLMKGQEYRLPLDKEWSCAVGLGHEKGTTPYEKSEGPAKIKGFPWGKDWPPPKGAGNYASSLNVDDFNETSPVGSFKANKFGLYDMGGNVWQWCEDLYDPNVDKRRVLRGGSCAADTPESLSSSYRDTSDPVVRYVLNGFRCVVVFVASSP